MKLRLPLALFRALMACFTAMASSGLVSASSATSSAVIVRLNAPDVEQTDTMLCWAASAADMLAVQTGQDAAAIYRCITEASGNTPGYVETALSWFHDGARGQLDAQRYDGSRTITRRDFDSLYVLANSVDEALKESGAASMMLYLGGDEQSTGHAVTVYGSEYEHGRLYLSFVDSADEVQGMRRAEIVETESGHALLGTDYVVASLSWLGEDGAAEKASAAPVGAIMHSSPTLQEYKDIAQNSGVYRFGLGASLIAYQNGEPNYTLQHTPSYSSSCDGGYFTLVNNGSFQLTVAHNGIMDNNTFSGRFVGDYAQKYSGVGIRFVDSFSSGRDVWSGRDNAYIPTEDDFRVERLTRLATDATSSAYCTDKNLLNNLNGVLSYRVGCGTAGVFDAEGNKSYISHYGLTAGISEITSTTISQSGNVYVYGYGFANSDFDKVGEEAPLPAASAPGDSGSPVYVYNQSTGQFELIGFTQGGDEVNTGTRYNPTATDQTIDYLREEIATGTSGATIYIEGAKVREDDEIITGTGNDKTYSAALHKGLVTQNGETIKEYNGVALDVFTEGTWDAMTEADYNSNTWYTYEDSKYINVKNDANELDDFGMKDLFYTSSLQFLAQTATQDIELKDNVDLGAGYVQFSLAEGQDSATFNLGKESSGNSISTSGFMVDKGVTLNNYLTYEAGRELRRVGEGVMNIVGTGNNDVLLNIGGGGLTYLDRTDGYGAYNVFVGTGATLRLADIGQVKHNITLGAGGGTLDLNGNDYTWSASEGNADGHFSLTVYEGVNRVETSAIANYAAGTASTVTITREGDFEFAGAFRDGSTYTQGSSIEMDSRYTMMPSELMGAYTQYESYQRQDSNSVLNVVYNGTGTMTMTGVYTILTGSNEHGQSGLTVDSGRVLLQGTNTIHAIDFWGNRLDNKQDWHFAMAEMGVQVNAGATFELGHHALLLGDVNVAAGGKYVMKQAINDSHEYVEGWYFAEDMSKLSAYYGHKGNVKLAAGAAMTMKLDEGVSTTLSYAGSISGDGSLTIAAGEGAVRLTGQNQAFRGEKTVESGDVYVASGAEGDTSANKWLIKDAGVVTLEAATSVEAIENLVDAQSTGVLALTQSIAGQINGSTMPGLIVGAAEGQTVHYGSAGVSLQAVNGQWTLGGGGGTLVVDFLLEGDNKLVLGNEYGTGTVRLNNDSNSFTGGIEIVGNITLEYSSLNALGQGSFTVGYGSVLNAKGAEILSSGRLDTASSGVLALEDNMQDLDLSSHKDLALAAKEEATLSGSLTVAEGAAYRFGGSGKLTVDTALSGAHDIIVDGQGGTGSEVVLNKASAASGDVIVQGGKTAGGDVTLSLAAGNALASASSVAVQNGGVLNLNGTHQTLNNLSGSTGGAVVDAIGNNTLTLNNDARTSYSGDIRLSGTDVVKVGAGALSLGGTNSWKSFAVNDGVIELTNGASLGGELTVKSGAGLHVTQSMTISHAVNISGFGGDAFGADGNGAALSVADDSTLNNGTSSLNVVEDAAVDGNLWFAQLNLKGNNLYVRDGDISFTDVVGENGRIILESGAWLTSMSGSGYDVQVNVGAGISLDGFDGGAKTSIELNGGTLYMSNYPNTSWADSTYAGDIRVLKEGGTIKNDFFHGGATETRQFNLTGKISGEVADSTLKFSAFKADDGSAKANVINVQGGLELAGNAALENSVVVNLQSVADIAGEFNVGADATAVIANEVSVGTLAGSGMVRIDGSAAALHFSSTGTDFDGTLSVVQGELHLEGLGSGASLGSIGTLQLGANGQLALSSLDAYGNSAGLLHIGALTGQGSLKLDLVGLETGDYRLLTSDSDLSWFKEHNNLAGSSRIELSSTLLENGSYALDLKVNSKLATVTWSGTGTLTTGVVDAEHITSDAGDSIFQTLDTLRLSTSSASSTETLTLGGEVRASSITYVGEGTLNLALAEGGKFTEGTDFVLNGSGLFDIGSTKALTGDVELVSGTISGTTDSLNTMKSISVMGNAGIELVSSSHLSKGINIARDAGLTVSIRGNTDANQWGANFDDNLSGEGLLILDLGSNQTMRINGEQDDFTGDIRVEGGTLFFGTDGVKTSIGASSISVARGASLELNAKDFSLAADVNWGNMYSILKMGANSTTSTLSGTQTVSGELTIQGNTAGKQLNITGDVKDGADEAGSLHLFGDAGDAGFKLVLSGNNSYSGGTTMNMTKGTVYAGNTNALGTGAVNLNAGTLSWQGVTTRGKNIWNGDLAVSKLVLGGGTIDTNGQDVTFSKAVEGSGALIKQGEGVLTLTGDLSYTGETVVEAGTLDFKSRLDSSAALTVKSGAEVAFAAANNRVGSMTFEDGATLKLDASLAGTFNNQITALAVDGLLKIDGTAPKLFLTGDLKEYDTFTVTMGSLEAIPAASYQAGPFWQIEADTRTTVSAYYNNTSIVFEVMSVGAADITWQGSATSSRWDTDSDNKVWEDNEYFFRHDRVTFGASDYKTIEVGEDGVYSDKITITEDGYSFSGGRVGTVAFSVAEGATAVMKSQLTSSEDLTYSGGGTLLLDGGQDIAGTLKITDGTVEILSSSGLSEGVQIDADGTLALSTAGQAWGGGQLRGEGTVRLEGGRYTAGALSPAFFSSTGEAVFSGTVAVGDGSTLSINATSSSTEDADAAASLGTCIRVEQGGRLSMDAPGYELKNNVDMAGGFLSFNRSGTLSGTVMVTADSAFSVAVGQQATFNGEMTGSGVLSKSGAGILSLNGLAGDGHLAVNEGALSIDGASSLGSLTMGAGSTLVMTQGELLTVGALNLTNVSLTLKGGLNSGHYELIQVTGNADVSSILSQISLSADTRLIYELSMENNLLTLDIAGTAAGSLVWQGTQDDNVWDAAAANKQWNVALVGSDKRAETNFMSGDDVRFTSAGAHDVVVAADGVQAGVVRLEDSGYSITGGAITAAGVADSAASGSNSIATDLNVSGALKKEGAGTLELSGNNSLGSVELKAGKLVAATDGALGSGTVTFSEGAALYVKDDAEVTNTLAGGNYTVGADKDEAGSFSGNAASSLLSSGFTKEGEGNVTVVNSKGQNPAGAMTVKAGTLSYDAGSSNWLGKVSGEGTFVLTNGAVNANDINVGKLRVENSVLAYNNTFDAKALEVSGAGAELRMGHWSSVNNSSLLLKDGGQLSMSSSGFNDSTVTVDGSGIIAVGETASADDNDVLDVKSTVSGNGTLYVTNYTGRNNEVYTTTFTKVISDGANGTLAVSTNQGDLHFNAANTYSGGTTITGGKLTTHNVSALGTGSVTLSGGTLALASELNINNLSGAAGTVDMGAHDLQVTQSVAGSYAGGLSGTGVFTKDGAAALSLTGTGLAAETLVVEQGVLNVNGITLSGALDMNLAEGTGLNITNLTMLDGSSLVYTGMSNYASIENVSGSLLLNLDSVMDRLTQAGSYDLGLNLSNVATTVQGYDADMYRIEFDVASGHSFIHLADGVYSTVAWDENWGVTDTAGKVWHVELAEDTALSGTKFDNGSRTAISVTGTEGTIDLYATTNDNTATSHDAWVEVSGGSIGTLAGSSGGNISGDTHFMVTGGTVANIIGFNATSANGAPTHTGNSYITVEEGASVTGSIIGAGVSTNGNGGTLNGSTNIFVNSVLSEGEASTGEVSHTSTWNYNAIIGGFARTLGYGVTWKIDGSTNVHVDVADYSGEAANFVKSIYGGNVSETYSHIGTITGNANVSIAANDKVTFTENVVAGSLKGGSEAERADIIKGNTTLSIDGGVYTGGTEKFLIGGSWVTGGTSTIEGTASVILTGDAQINRHVYVAGFSGGGKSTVGATRLEIGKDVTFGSGIKLSGGFTTSANGTVTGNRTLALQDGVDLDANSQATLENFDHIEVAKGSATVNSAQTNVLTNITKTGSGTLYLSGSEAVSSNLTLEEGGLHLNGQSVSNAIVFSGDADKTVTGSLALTTPDSASFTYSGSGAVVVDAAITNSKNRLVFNVASAGKENDFAEVTVNGVIGTTGTSFGIDKNGSGTLKLSGANSFAWGFSLNAGRVIAADDSALGTGSIDVATNAVLEIASGAHVSLNHRVKFEDGAELRLHALSTDVAALSTTGAGISGNNELSGFGVLTLTLEEDIQLESAIGYKVLSLGTNVKPTTNDDSVTVNYEGNGRFSFSTRFESNTLLLDVAKDDNADLVWDGTEEGAVWNQLAQNKNWERANELGADTSFMNLDSVSFTDAAAHKNVAVAEEGVQVQSMTVSAEGYSFSGGAVKTDSASLQETVSLEQGASLNLGTVYTVSQQDSKAAGSVAAVVMTSDLSAMKGAIQGAVEGAQARLDNVVIDIAKGASLELNDVLLSQNSRITDDPASVSMNNVTVELGAANTTIEGLTTVPSALVATGGDASFNLEADTSIVSVFCSALDTVTVTGSSLTLDLSGIANSLSTDWKDSEYVAISFGQSKDSLAHFDGKNLSITATYDGSTYNTVYVKMDEQSSTTTLYVANKASDAVPEPTTATLSLLALSMLAARRRRK